MSLLTYDTPIIIARFREDIEWIKKFKFTNIIVYEKEQPEKNRIIFH